MGVPHITSFCFCMGLEAGTKLIGFLHLITSVCMLIVCTVFAASAARYVDDPVYFTWYMVAVFVALVSVVHILLAFTLLYAAYKRSWLAARVWVCAMCALAVGALLYVLVSAFKGFHGSGSDIFLSFLEGILFFGILGYCILCVFSYHLLLKSAAEMDAPNKEDF